MIKLLLLLTLAVTFCVASERVVLGSRTTPVPGWHIGPVAHPTTTVSFYLALKQQNLDKLEDLFWAVSDPDSPSYREFRTISEILDIVAPPTQDVAEVQSWLRAHNIEEIRNYGDALFVTTSALNAEKLFKTKFHHFKNENNGKTIIRMAGEYSIPARIAELVDFVSGITEFPVPHYNAKPSPQSPETLVSISPQSINILYNVPPGTASTSNSSICVAEFEDQFFSPSDLSQFSQQFKVSINTVNKIVGTNDPSSPGVEAELDIQYATAIAPGAEPWFWIEGDSVWLYGYSTHLFQTTPAPLVNSISYGWNEEDQCEYGIGGTECSNLGVNSKQYVQRVNVEFQKIGIRGITLVCASGDSGANGRTDPYCTDSTLHPAFPAASPYITSVGATMITQQSGVSNLPNPPPGCQGNQCASGGIETAVSFDQANFASGGGFSWVASRPSYQNNAVKTYLNGGTQLPPGSYYNQNGRGFPDVAALGSNVLINVQGEIQPVGGTSASSPIFAGLMSMINGYVQSKSGRPLGFLNPLLYKMAAEHPAAFHDITVGDNKCTEDGCSDGCQGFICAKGWDPVTGLGTPVYKEMDAYIRKTVLKESE